MHHTGTITIDGFDLAYRVEGKGSPVLVVGSELYYPRLFSAEIKKHVQLVFIDHRGFAHAPTSDFPLESCSLERIVDDIEFMRAYLDVKDFVILGHSGHAFLAVAYAKKYPAHVRKVVVLNSAPTNNRDRQQQSFAFFEQDASPERKRTFETEMAKLKEDIEKEPERRFAHMCIRMGAHSFYDYAFDATAMWEGVETNMPILDYLWGDVFARMNLIEELVDFPKPVLIGLGRYDYLVGPVSLWDSLKENPPHLTKVIFERSGHNPMFEEAALFDSILVKWITE